MERRKTTNNKKLPTCLIYASGNKKIVFKASYIPLEKFVLKKSFQQKHEYLF